MEALEDAILALVFSTALIGLALWIAAAVAGRARVIPLRVPDRGDSSRLRF